MASAIPSGAGSALPLDPPGGTTPTRDAIGPVAVEIDSLTVRYGDRTALDSLSLQVGEGERLALLGPNGAGKSSLLSVLATLRKPSGGSAMIRGVDVGRHPLEARRHLGIVFQGASLDRKLTVRENLLLLARLYGLRGRDRDTRVDGAIERMQLTDRARDPVSQLSGGLARRVEIARALLHSPSVLLLDEPTSGLDPTARNDLWRDLVSLSEEGTTLLTATHLGEEADRAHRVLILDEGRCVAQGTPDEVRSSVGGQVLIVEVDDPQPLADELARTHRLTAKVLDGRLHIEHDQAHRFIPELIESHPRPHSLRHHAAADTRRRLRSHYRSSIHRGGHGRHDMTGAGVLTTVQVMWQRDLLHFTRERARILAAVGQPLLLWLFLGSGFGSGIEIGSIRYLEFFFPGMAMLVVLFATIFSTISLIDDREQGFLRAVLSAPVSRMGVVAGKSLGAATLATLQGGVVLLLAPLCGIPMSWDGFLLALLALFLSAYALAGLGIALAWRSPSTAAYHAAMNFFLLPLWLLSGTLFPLGGTPGWLALIIQLNPLTYAVQAVRHALYRGAALPDVGISVEPALCWAALLGFVVLTQAILPWAIARPAERS